MLLLLDLIVVGASTSSHDFSNTLAAPKITFDSAPQWLMVSPLAPGMSANLPIANSMSSAVYPLRDKSSLGAAHSAPCALPTSIQNTSLHRFRFDGSRRREYERRVHAIAIVTMALWISYPEDDHLIIMVPAPTELVQKKSITHGEFIAEDPNPHLPGGGEIDITHSIFGHANLENAGGFGPLKLLKTIGREASLDILARR